MPHQSDSSTHNDSTSPPSPPPPSPSSASIPKEILVELAVYLVILLAGLFALLPLHTPHTHHAYLISLACSFGTYAYKFIKKHGMSFSALGTELSAQYMLTTLIFLTTPLSFGFLLNVIAFSLFNFARRLDYTLQQLAPSVHERVKSWIYMVLTKKAELNRFIAMNELFIGVANTVGLFTADRSIMRMFFYWRFYLQRYQTSHEHRLVVAMLKYQMDTWTNHPNCPGFLHSAWHTILRWMAQINAIVQQAVQQRQQQQQQQHSE